MSMDQLTGTFVPEDPRSDEEKAQDYTPEEILGGSVSVPVWKARDTFDWDVWSLRTQSTSSSCGGQAGAKAIEGFTSVVASANPIYRFRKNYDGEGMWAHDIADILKKSGTTGESRSPSQTLTEAEMNGITTKYIADLLMKERYTISAYYFHAIGGSTSMDAIAQSLEMGHAIVFLVRTNADEWQEVVEHKGGDVTFSHFVTAVGKRNYTLHNGERCIVIDDSCNAFSTLKKDGKPTGQRLLTESFVRNRVASIMALVPSQSTKTNHIFTKFLTYGMRNDSDVVALQNILKERGYMDTNIPSTGNFLKLTAKAVVKWQVSNGMDDFAHAPLSAVRVGPKSVALLNSYNK